MRLSRASIALYMVLVFASGALLGVFGTRYINSVTTVNKRAGGKDNDRRMRPEEYRRNYVAFMEKRLNLTPEQVTQLGQLLDSTRQSMDELMRSTIPAQQALRQTQTEKIRSLLTEEQIPEYEKMLKEREAFGKNKNKRDGRPGPR